MKAFNGEASVKEEYMARLAAHRENGDIVHDVEWKDGKGGAVACTVHAYARGFDLFEKELGIPGRLARIEDRIFDGLRGVVAFQFPEQFLEAIEPGADLSLVPYRFYLRILDDDERGVSQARGLDNISKECEAVTACLKRILEGDESAKTDLKLYRSGCMGDLQIDTARAVAYMGSYAIPIAAQCVIRMRIQGPDHYEWMRDILLEEIRAVAA